MRQSFASLLIIRQSELMESLALIANFEPIPPKPMTSTGSFI